MNKIIFSFFITFAVCSCDGPGLGGKGVNDASKRDRNNDGKADVFYEYSKDGYYEIWDINFDGKTDESYFYGDGIEVISSKHDQNFDGYPETKYYYQFGSPVIGVVDIHIDNLYDIYFEFLNGSLVSSYRYFSDHQDPEKSYVEKYTYQYGHPVGMEKTLVGSLHQEFHDYVENEIAKAENKSAVQKGKGARGKGAE